MKSSARRLVYLGWQGFSNFGDDLLYETWKKALDADLEIEAPLFLKDYVKRGLGFLRDRVTLFGSEKLVLLGGGTTVGFKSWASHAHNAITLYGARGILLVGPGAAASNDAYALGLQQSNWTSWHRVPGTVLFGVRGPLTANESRLNWQRPCPVVGDPALMYPVVAGLQEGPVREGGVIGVCLGSQTATRFDIHVVAEGIRSAVSTSSELNEIRVYQLADSDRAVARSLSEYLGGVDVISYDGDVEKMMLSIAECSAFVSERLHGAVAAVSLGVPTVPLSYASKCDDFWLSVTGQRPRIQVGSSAQVLAEEILSCTEPHLVAEIERRRGDLVQRLLMAASAIRDWQQGDISLAQLSQTAFRMRHDADSLESSNARKGTQVARTSVSISGRHADIAVVVPYGYGLELLRSQIARLIDQDFAGNVEIVVSCNREILSESELVSGSLPNNFNLRIIDSSAVVGPSHARNMGWRDTSAAKIVFCDADDEVDRRWLQSMSDALDTAELVGGRLDYSALNDARDAAWHYQTTKGLPRKFRHLTFAPSSNLGTLRAVLEQLHGFDEDLRYGEDIDFCWRAQYAGFSMAYSPDAVVAYRLRSGLRNVWNQAFNYGASDAALLSKHKHFGARRHVSDTIAESLATPWAAVTAIRRPWLFRKFLTRAGNQTGRAVGSFGSFRSTMRSLADGLGR
ncbi:polysaccharide pyruvyl transferase family protein [Pseudarthrobacter equi]|uniref:polysaccharide pyruvyl transferase family protein n=1 Tax=Pseudarthrobacter equi TaxID=728066 RepID=UPI0021BFF532|nr:polysaccharide pyruvyl transferase family protein [Pseudarthrobacter equi]MCT9625603.1 polysaccharide pyruvyl transferase family protein [Pseudarthrobacter equi]